MCDLCPGVKKNTWPAASHIFKQKILFVEFLELKIKAQKGKLFILDNLDFSKKSKFWHFLQKISNSKKKQIFKKKRKARHLVKKIKFQNLALNPQAPIAQKIADELVLHQMVLYLWLNK